MRGQFGGYNIDAKPHLEPFDALERHSTLELEPPGWRACAWPSRRAIATRSIFTGSRRGGSNGDEIYAFCLADRG